MPASLLSRLKPSPKAARPASAGRRVDGVDWPDGGKILADLAARALLTAIADHSPFLWGLIEADPARAVRLLNESPESSLARIASSLRDAPDAEPELMRALRSARLEAALLIALADLGGVFALEETIEALSDFADWAVAAALRHLLRAASSAGRLALDADAPERDCGFFVLALGKHGGRELNYSSDIDLALFFDATRAPVAPGIEPEDLFVRIGKGLVRLLQSRTEDGYVARVDLRLRPDPGAHAIAVPIDVAENYYETLGQNWERAAYIKARVVAGDASCGARFLESLVPFIWRKYFDYAAIADIHAMKRQIHAARGHETVTVAGHDVKLGRGGIREIEFFAQTQQLVFGGRRPQLRGARTLATLAELRAEGWIGADAERELAEAYRFLRAIEHRLQMLGDEQTQRLPVESDDLARFAKFCGYSRLAAFESALLKRLGAVERHYARLFERAPTLGDSTGSLVFTGVADDPETLATLRGLGFVHPEQAADTVRGWHFGRRQAVSSPRAREVLTELTPGLLRAFADSGDADSALNAFDAMLARMPASVELLSILRGHPRILALLGDVLGGAPALADVVSLSPHVLDAAIDPDRAASPLRSLDPRRARERLESQLAGAPDYESTLERARAFACEQRFLIGLALFSDAIDADVAARAYSALAEGIVQAMLERARRAFAADHGSIAGGEVAILALGKLGSREMTAASDLDLIVLYDFPADAADSHGPRPLAPDLYFARLTQRFITALTAPTRTGPLYEVDMRLRPSGRKGPLATSLAAFAHYQNAEAWTWEHLALTRARIVAGDMALAGKARRVLRATLRKRRDIGELFADVEEMRRLMAAERKPAHAFDPKLADGGLIDVEFIAQTLILAHAHDHPGLLDPSTHGALTRLAKAGLIEPAALAELGDALRLFSDVTQLARLALRPPFDVEGAADGVRRRIALASAAPTLAAVKDALGEAEAKVRHWRRALLGFALD